MREDQGKLLTKEEVKQQLRGLGKVNDPVGQVAYLKKLEEELRNAYLWRHAGRGEISEARHLVLKRFVRREKEKAGEWKEQYLARSVLAQTEITGRAFTASSGSVKFQDHLHKVRRHNKALCNRAESYALLRHNPEGAARGLDPGKVEELVRSFAAKVKDHQEQVLDLIEDYADSLKNWKNRKKYLKLMLQWYEEADYIHRRYAGIRPFDRVRAGIKVLLNASHDGPHERTLKISRALAELAEGYENVEALAEGEFGGKNNRFKRWASKVIDQGYQTAYRALVDTRCYIKGKSGKRGSNLLKTLQKTIDYSASHEG